ncbi:PadR family transcriptional regulator [Lacticaseibacillus kribbianus]|uniref:PadR family transcriptional regulator n=1 Tax=Lacticaseibacillus kribbianus TaxID=2926292 RepID=UPI001CD28CEA|nr:PadR family transcriptional regulator [Lacticaseibacillus kribbianus]
MNGSTELLKGALDGIIMQRISQGETYGYEITQYLADHGLDDIVEGTVYTALLRLEKKGLLDVTRRQSKLGPARKFYSLNEAGKMYLADFWLRWDWLTATVAGLRR